MKNNSCNKFVLHIYILTTHLRNGGVSVVDAHSDVLYQLLYEQTFGRRDAGQLCFTAEDAAYTELYKWYPDLIWGNVN